ncbi:LOW QUALITY PROTEIN: Hypothetical protein PHPALM_18431 [Phytophthora palmivora]|uniref:Uncharacterized protein n=1 Tax=Phytophthora palmivora TaxID=4796 RepID=A0A2P4XJY3_9STRA|nr:LOW QUALITY PROTEIN: Hypothetical protein PHPALM_18431 [Phytophthora palmivora]
MVKPSGVSIRAHASASSTHDRIPQLRDSNVQMQIEESERATLQTTLDCRPSNTKRKYEGYQKDFVAWCDEHHFCDGSTVTKGKLHLFLSEEVVGIEKKGNIVGGSTVCGYVNAIVDLYNQQVAIHINSNKHPRPPQVKQLIKNVQTQTTATPKKSIRIEVLNLYWMATIPKINFDRSVTLFFFWMTSEDEHHLWFHIMGCFGERAFATWN